MNRREDYVWQDRRPSALSTFFKCIAAVTAVGIGCGTGLAFRGMSLLDSKTGQILNTAGKAFTDLPQVLKQLPPVLSDALKDQRDPKYAGEVKIATRVKPGDEDRLGRGVIEIENTGDRIISMLALHIVGIDEEGEPVRESTLYGATPLAADTDWRGPLYPGTTRRIPVTCGRSTRKIEAEIVDLRTWNGASSELAARN